MQDARLTILPTARKVKDQLVGLSRGGCILGHRLTTLPQLVDSLWIETGDRRVSLGHTGERLSLNEAVARVRSRSQGVSISSGMSEHMLALIRRLKSAAITAGDWRRAAVSLPAPARARLTDFSAVFGSYQELLAERGLADRHDREGAALELIHRMEVSGGRPQLLIGVSQLVVAEIYDLSLIQFMIIAGLIRIVGDAEVTIQAAPHKVDAIGFADLTWNRFVGEESIANQVLPDFVRRDGRSGQLGFILEHLFGPATDSRAPRADGTVTMIEAANAREEAEAAARAICRRLEQDPEKISLDRIAIVARDLGPYNDYLEAAFRRYHIPLQRELGPPLRATIPARAILEILRLPLENFPRESLIALCDSALMALAAARYRTFPREAGYIDETTRPLRECLAQRREVLREALAAAEANTRDQAASRLAALERGERVWAELLETLNALATPAAVAGHLVRLSATLERLHFDPAAASIDDSAARAAGPVWRALDDLAAAATRVMPERILELREFIDLLETTLGETTTEALRDGSGGVRVLPILEARGLDFDLVIVLGLNDGSFPRYNPENPLVTDETSRIVNRGLRAQLKERFADRMPSAPGPILRSRGERNSEEPFLFFLALSMPARAVVLSYAREDERGRPLEASPFIVEMRAHLGAECQFEDRASYGLASWADCFTERDFLNSAASVGQLDAPWFEHLPESCGITSLRRVSISRRIQIERHRADYFARPSRETLFARRQRAARKAKDWTSAAMRAADEEKDARAGEFDGRVAPDARLAQALLAMPSGAVRPWSAKQLSEMAACGFNFFARRILRLQDIDELEHEPSRLEIGDLVHRILADFFDARPDFANPAAAIRLAEQAVERFRPVEAAAARDPAFFELRWTTVREMIAEAVLHEITRRAQSGTPGELEHEYRLEFPITLGDAAGTQITIAGWIDRLELYLDPVTRLITRLRVVDYKTSRNLKSLADLLKRVEFATTDMQMPVYLLGAVAQLRERLAPAVTIEASYIALQNRTKETAPLEVPRELLEDGRDALVTARIRELVAEAVAGRFVPDPLECSEYCPYRPVCRFQKPAAH